MTKVVIVGTRFCAKEARELLRGSEVGTPVSFVPEPTNPFDKNAVKALINGTKVGYISKEETALTRGHEGGKLVRDFAKIFEVEF